MAVLPSAGSESTIGVAIVTKADTAGIAATQAQLDALKANTEALNTVTGKLNDTAGTKSATAFQSFNSGLKTVGQQSIDVGKSLSTYISLPIAAIAGESVKMAMTFEQSMELLHTNAGIPQAQIKSLGDQILNLAGAVGQTPDELAQGFYHIATAGQGIYTTSQMLAQLKTAAEGAAIGQANLDDTSYALTSTLAANVKGATNFNDTMGTLLGIVQAGDMHLSDMNSAIGTGLMGTLAQAGVSLRSAGAALADFGDLGERGAAAATRLRMMIALMTSPSKQASDILGTLGLDAEQAGTATDNMNKVFEATGLSTTKLADDLRQPNGISVAITDLKDHLDTSKMSVSEMDSVLAKAFGGGRTDAALLQLLNTIPRLNEKYKQIGQDSTNFANNWQVQQQQAKQQWAEAWDGIQSDMIRLGVTIMPEVTHGMKDVSGAISGVTNWFTHLSAGQKQFVIDAGGVLAIMGPVLVIFGTMAKSVSNIITLTNTFGKGFSKIAGSFMNDTGLMNKAITGVGGYISELNAAAEGSVAAWGIYAGAILGVVADLYLVVKAGQTVIDTINTVKQMNAGEAADKQSETSAISQMEALTLSSDPAKRQRAITALHKLGVQGYATGTNYAPGGWSMVGENGPEPMYVPQGAVIKTNSQLSSINSGNSNTISIGQIVLPGVTNASEFLQALDRDTQLQGMGMSPARGMP